MRASHCMVLGSAPSWQSAGGGGDGGNGSGAIGGIDGDGGGGGDGGGRIFLEDPTPINPRRDNISRKDNPSLRYIISIFVNKFDY